jgi:hypothetical protein
MRSMRSAAKARAFCRIFSRKSHLRLDERAASAARSFRHNIVGILAVLEARSGIEPLYAALQAAA